MADALVDPGALAAAAAALAVARAFKVAGVADGLPATELAADGVAAGVSLVAVFAGEFTGAVVGEVFPESAIIAPFSPASDSKTSLA
jgi:hypothetical protein